MRPIDADALMKELEREVELADDWKTAHEISNCVKYAPTIGGWISVKNRLPETRHAVLVYTPLYKNIWAVSMHEDGNWYIWSPGGGVLLDPDWHGQITHWMPLPEPPEEEK